MLHSQLVLVRRARETWAHEVVLSGAPISYSAVVRIAIAFADARAHLSVTDPWLGAFNRHDRFSQTLGGVVEHIKHEVKILCPVVSLPEKLELNINSLKLNQSLTLADLPLPAGAKLLTDPEDIIVHCVTPKAELEEGAVAPVEPGEPEVIGRKKEEEGDEAAEEKK